MAQSTWRSVRVYSHWSKKAPRGMRSLSLRPSHHLPWAVVRCRSGSPMAIRACQGTTRASWSTGWVGETSMVTGCTQQGVSSPEKQMRMGMPSRLHGFWLCWLVTLKASHFLDNCNPSALGVGAYPNFAPATIYTDKITGTKAERPGLTQALSHLREGDTLVVWRLDRLGRSLPHLIETVTALQRQGVAFQSITENIDTSNATGKLVFHIFGALAEFERNLIKERTMAGLSAARARGRIGGRPRLDASARQVAAAKKLYRDKTNSIAEICKMLNISRATLYRYIKATQVTI